MCLLKIAFLVFLPPLEAWWGLLRNLQKMALPRAIKSVHTEIKRPFTALILKFYIHHVVL